MGQVLGKNKNDKEKTKIPEASIVIVGAPEVGVPMINYFVHDDWNHSRRASAAIGVSQHCKIVDVKKDKTTKTLHSQIKLDVWNLTNEDDTQSHANRHFFEEADAVIVVFKNFRDVYGYDEQVSNQAPPGIIKFLVAD